MRPPTRITRDDGIRVAQPTRRLTPGEARRWLVRHGGDCAHPPNSRHDFVAENHNGTWLGFSARFSGWPQGRVNPLWFGVLTHRKAIAV